jgi:hypothetical protein
MPLNSPIPAFQLLLRLLQLSSSSGPRWNLVDVLSGVCSPLWLKREEKGSVLESSQSKSSEACVPMEGMDMTWGVLGVEGRGVASAARPSRLPLLLR